MVASWNPMFTVVIHDLRLSDFTSCALEPEFVLHIGKDILDFQSDDESLLKSIDFVSPGLRGSQL